MIMFFFTPATRFSLSFSVLSSQQDEQTPRKSTTGMRLFTPSQYLV
jgi:hypothetical protein